MDGKRHRQAVGSGGTADGTAGRASSETGASRERPRGAKRLLHSLKRGFYSMGMHKKLMLTFLVLSLVPTLCLGLFSYARSYQNILTQKQTESRNAMKNIGEYVNEKLLDEAEYSAITLAIDKNVRELLSADAGALGEQQALRLRYDIKKRAVESAMRTEIEDIAVLGTNGELISSRSTLAFDLSWMMADAAFREYASSGRGAYVGTMLSAGRPYQYLCRKVYPLDRGRTVGYVFAWVRGSSLRAVFDRYRNDYTGIMVAADPAGLVLASSGGGVAEGGNLALQMPGITKSGADGTALTLPDGTRSFVYSYRDPAGEYVVYNFVPHAELTDETNKILVLTLMLMLLMIVLSVALAAVFARFFTVPILRLAQTMVKADTGNMHIDFIPKYDDEVGYLARCYNQMAEKLNHQARELTRTEEERRKAEMRAFEAQIKPHFLYNTLSTVIWLIENGEYDKAIGVVTSLSRLFRISLSRGKNLIPIEKELEHIRCYLSIQKVRYEEQFRWEIEADDALLSHSTVKMILQPLVENAIYHSMKLIENGVIRVSCFSREEAIVMRVADNGGLLDQAAMNKLNRVLWEKVPAEGLSIGIGVKNVHDRVHLTYRGSYGLRYLRENGWTVAEITIPWEESEEGA